MSHPETFNDDQTILDVLGFAGLAVKYLGDRPFEEFVASESDRICVTHEVLMIGEACRRFSAEFRQAHPEMNLQKWTRLRNSVIHVYQRVDYFALYQVVQNELPALIRELTKLAPKQD